MKNNVIEKRKFTEHVCFVDIPTVPEFVVGEFFREYAEIEPKIYLGRYFNLILSNMKEMRISLLESKLEKSVLIKKAWDSEIHMDFPKDSKPIIPIKQFLCQLKVMIEVQPNGEVKENGLDTDNTNIFNVDLSEICIYKVVTVLIEWNTSDLYWLVNACDFDDEGDRFGETNSFFSPVTV